MSFVYWCVIITIFIITILIGVMIDFVVEPNFNMGPGTSFLPILGFSICLTLLLIEYGLI